MTSDFAENTYGIAKRLQVIREWLKDERRNAKTTTVLDYGCGTGEHVTYPLALDGYEVLGVDTHAPSIELAQARHRRGNLAFRTASLEILSGEGRLFDAVVCSEVLEHLEQPRPFLVALKQLLTPGGVLIITTPNGYGSYEILCSVQRVLQRTGINRLARSIVHAKPENNGSSGFLNQESVHVQFFRLKILEAIFKDSGLLIAQRRARTLICGPYADVVFDAIPFRNTLMKWNAAMADVLPLRCAADWMFLLRMDEK